MYIWPFAAGSLVLTWWDWSGPKRFLSTRFWLPLALLILAGIPTSWRYIATSAGWPGAATGFVEIPQATHAHLLDQLRALAADVDHRGSRKEHDLPARRLGHAAVIDQIATV